MGQRVRLCFGLEDDGALNDEVGIVEAKLCLQPPLLLMLAHILLPLRVQRGPRRRRHQAVDYR
jgi:hypothetical protein